MSKVELQVRQLMPEDLPLVDDNSDFTLMGYQNFLIEPRVGTSSTSHPPSSSVVCVCCRLGANNMRPRLRIGAGAAASGCCVTGG